MTFLIILNINLDTCDFVYNSLIYHILSYNNNVLLFVKQVTTEVEIYLEPINRA